MSKTHYHFIGIAGIGMSALAKLLIERGDKVSGSDQGSSTLTEKLSELGAKIYSGHEARNITGAETIIVSSAIRAENPELAAAREQGLRILKRGELLAELFNKKTGLAVAGSHGKTTTSSLLATVFHETQRSPSAAVGGIISHLKTNAFSGSGEYFIAESDESDGSFLWLNPFYAILTNIDNDHVDHYGSVEDLSKAFVSFLGRVPEAGKVIVNADDPGIQKIPGLIRENTSFGFTSGDYRASKLECSANGSQFLVTKPDGISVSFFLPHLGRHNVANAMGVIALCFELGFSETEIQQGLSVFRGVGRRLEKILSEKKFILLDDYGHHPTEIRTTIDSIKEVDPRPLTVIFEPHRFSRTKNFWQDFIACFASADKVYISPIYAASESPIPGITSEALVEDMKKFGVNVEFLPELSGMKSIKNSLVNEESILLTLGAGPISKKIREIVTVDCAPTGAR